MRELEKGGTVNEGKGATVAGRNSRSDCGGVYAEGRDIFPIAIVYNSTGPEGEDRKAFL